MLSASSSLITVISSSITSILRVESLVPKLPQARRCGKVRERIQFVRENYDSLIGQFLNPITNYFTMVGITNGRGITEPYQRVITTPDIIFSAADLTAGPATGPTFLNTFTRNVQFDQSTILNGLANRSTIPPGITITLNMSRSRLFGREFIPIGLGTNSFLGTAGLSVLAWGSFDGTTNAPIVYPNGQALQDLSQILITISPSTVPDGTNGVPYSVTLNVTGGVSPYTISAPNINALVPGLV